MFLADVLAWFADPGNWQGTGGVPYLLVQHLGFTAASMGFATAIAVPLGLWIGHTGRGAVLAVQVSNIGRAVPTLAVLVILVLLPEPFGRSTTSALIAFTLFAIPAMLTNTYVGMREVDRGTVDAARGMGLTPWQVLLRVELPLATPLIMNGVRVAAVQVFATVSIAAIAAFGGLGRIITRATGGVGGTDLAALVAGALIIAVLAVALDLVLAGVTRLVDPLARARAHRGRSDDSDDSDDSDERAGSTDPTGTTVPAGVTAS